MKDDIFDNPFTTIEGNLQETTKENVGKHKEYKSDKIGMRQN